MDNLKLTPSAFAKPAVMLSGAVDYAMYGSFRGQFDAASERDLVVVELSTLGGDPEVARMMGEDIRYASEMAPQRRFVFLGKAAIYSAGTTFMSFFVTQNRYVTRGTRIMIHERKLSKELKIDGPLTTCIATLKATLHEIEASIEIQNEGFANLIKGIARDDGGRAAPRAGELVYRGQRGEGAGADLRRAVEAPVVRQSRPPPPAAQRCRASPFSSSPAWRVSRGRDRGRREAPASRAARPARRSPSGR